MVTPRGFRLAHLVDSSVLEDFEHVHLNCVYDLQIFNVAHVQYLRACSQLF